MNGSEYFLNDIKKSIVHLQKLSDLILTYKDEINYLDHYFKTTAEDQPEKYNYHRWGSKPHFSFWVKQLNSFQDKALTDVLDNVEFVSDEHNGRSSTTDFPEGYSRAFDYELPFCTISINTTIKSDSQQCRRIKTGEETTTIDKYILECN